MYWKKAKYYPRIRLESLREKNEKVRIASLFIENRSRYLPTAKRDPGHLTGTFIRIPRKTLECRTGVGLASESLATIPQRL
jgi:hypothetical protein